MKAFCSASRIGAVLLLLNAGILLGQPDLQVELPIARTKLEAMLPTDMRVSRAEIVALTEGLGILLHAFPVDTNQAHPSFALFLWPITNPRNIPYETGEGTHTFRRIGSSEKFLVYYSGPSGFMKEEISHAFCSFDCSFNLSRDGTNFVIHWRIASDDGYPVFLQRAASPAGPWQTLTNAVEPYIEPVDPAARGFFRKVRFL
jgi:hypothetical protein